MVRPARFTVDEDQILHLRWASFYIQTVPHSPAWHRADSVHRRARQIQIPVKIDFLAISTFSNKSSAPCIVRIAKDLDDGIENEDVLLVEDIVDTGPTLRYLLQALSSRGPNSLAVCTFLDRNSRRLVQIPVEFRCFEIPDRFVIGFGLDHNQLYRYLSYVAVMKPERNG